jgi:regulatory protein
MSDPGDPRAATRRAALTLLNQRPYTVERLTRLLLRRGLEATVVHSVVADLQESGLLDDEAFARGYVEQHAGERGARRLALDLRRRGVDPEVIASALGELDHEQEQDTALALLQRHRARFAGLERQVAYRRAVGFLARRGFPGGAVHDAVRKVLGDLETEDD